MIKDYNFNEIKKYLKKDSDIGNDILDAFDSLTDAAIIFSPIVFGPQLLPLFDLLDVKDRLVNLGKKVYTAISNKLETDYITRTEQIRAAYALICYTAFFDALQDTLPKDIINKLKLKLEDKNKLIKDANEGVFNKPKNRFLPTHGKVFYVDHVTSFVSIKEQLINIYIGITENIIKMIVDSSIFDESNKKDMQSFELLKESLNLLPEKAFKVYESQYIYLADNFGDFALFAQMKNFEGMQQTIIQNGETLKLLTNVTDKIDLGLSSLNEIVNSIPSNFAKIHSQNIIDELKRKYVALINEPIINDEEITSDSETIRLKFPKIVDAFIPQSYKCMLYEQKGTKLEDTPIWDNIPERNDIDKFFVEYLYSLDSIDYPLIILGQPGSGKSLLTKVLSAQLMSDSYTVIRIPLRDVNADDNIDVLVEDQIKKMTNRPLSAEGYGGFASQFSEKPLVIILDGYDELLQAKGSVFSSYLEKVRMFQQNQKQLNRPVRIIVTSRITLIDKARIPINSTVLRLMEFNKQQREAWINVWNNTNIDYFSNNNIQPFSLSEHENKGRNNIIELAEQPLLLLMLALYDSEENELAKTSNIKRTELYDNLLRRFIRRERSRYILDFEDKSTIEQEIIIDNEMNRLGVIAIGMYNRRDVVIRSEQLEKDLDAFDAHRNNEHQENRTLTDAESVLGGFFFIHKSTAQDADANSDNATNAYEFLHNTFGEFLAADFILRNTIIEVKDSYVDRIYKSPELNNTFSRLSPDLLKPCWFYCLMFVPLYSRPVVVEMLREHATRAFNHFLTLYAPNIKMNNDDYEDNLKYIAQNQLKMILNTRNCPKVMRNGILFDNDMPLLGYLATYTLNLIILVSTISSTGFEFIEDDYRQIEKNEHDLNPWSKLTSLWKSWFAPADLVGLSVVLKAIRKNKNSVIVKCNDRFEANRYEQPIDVLLCLSATLADTFLMSLSGIQTTKFREITCNDFSTITEILKKEHFDLFVKYLISLLRREIINVSDNNIIEKQLDAYKSINYIIEELLGNREIFRINFDTRLELLEIIEICLLKKLVFFDNRRKLVKYLPKLIARHLDEDGNYREYRMIDNFHNMLLLLVPNHTLLTSNKKLMYNELRYKSSIFGHEWAKDFEHIMHMSLRFKDDEFVSLPEAGVPKTSFATLLDVIKKSNKRISKTYLRLLECFLDSQNIDVLMETDPESLSYALLIYLKAIDFQYTKITKSISMFFEHMHHLIMTVGIGYLGFDTIINAIEIAKITKNQQALNAIKQLFYKLLRDMPLESLVSFINIYPRVIDKLIGFMPELFDEISNRLSETIIYQQKIHYTLDKDRIFSYIRVVRKLHSFQTNKYLSKSMYSKYLYDFANIIIDYIDTIMLETDELSFTQVDDILWCISYSNNNRLRDEIRKKLNKYSFLKDVLKDK